MLIDLHAHYPMRVISDLFPDTALREMRRLRRRPTMRDRLRALVLRLASIFFSHRNPFRGYRVTAEGMRDGGVGVALSVLTRPFDEAGLARPYASPPESKYFDGLLDDLNAVEVEVAARDRDVIRLAHDRQELEQSLADGATALVHCVEGGFSLGEGTEEIQRNVAELARQGVAYITLAHLLYRQVATNSSALPFLTDRQYRRVFPQPEGAGLTDRGVSAIRAMVRNRVMIDISHMRGDALEQTFELLDGELDPRCQMPVLATHVGYRFGTQEYMLDEAAVLQIKRRHGLVGLILAQHQLNDGVRDTPTESFDDSLSVLFTHIDKIAAICDGYRHLAIGTDFDGFIKPTLTGLDSMADLAKLERALEDRYHENAKLITSENVLRVMRQLWA